MPDQTETKPKDVSGDIATTDKTWEELKAQIDGEGNILLEQPSEDNDLISDSTGIPTPATETVVDETPEGGESSPVEKPDWKDPEGWENHYYPKDPSKLSEILKSDPETFKRVFGDPVGDNSHIFHKPFRDTQTALHEKAEQLAELQRNIQAIAQQLRTENVSGKDDPENAVFGGVSAEDVDSDSSLFSTYSRARERYYNKQAILAEDARMRANAAREQERTEIEFKAKHPDVDIETIYNDLSVTTKDGKRNPNFRPITLEDGRILQVVRSAGSLEKYVENVKLAAYEDGKKAALTEIASKKGVSHLSSKDQDGDVKIPEIPKVRTAEDVQKLTPEQFEKFALTVPFLRGR